MNPPMPSIASAISFRVISSSPAPSATALTTAIALRIRSAADRPVIRPLLGDRLAGTDDDPAVGFLADARARDLGIAFQGEMNGSPLEGLHGVERDRVAR